MRYCKQRDKFSCAPIALLNVLKWAGYPYTYADLGTLQEECGCTCEPGRGTFPEDFDKALKKRTDLSAFKVQRPAMFQIESALWCGEAVILRYVENDDRNKESHGHYIACVGVGSNKFLITNDLNRRGEMQSSLWVTRDDFTDKVQTPVTYYRPEWRKEPFCLGWFIKRK